MTFDRCNQRFRRRAEDKVAAEIADQQPVGAGFREKAQQPGFIREFRPVDPARPSAEHWVNAS